MKYDESMLSAFLDGELSPAEVEVVEKQLAHSAADRELLASLTQLHQQLAAIPAETFAEDPALGVRALIAREIAGSQPQSETTPATPDNDAVTRRASRNEPSSAPTVAAADEVWRSTGPTQWWKPIIGLATAACLLGVVAWFGRATTTVSQNTDSAPAASARGGAAGDEPDAAADLARSIPEAAPTPAAGAAMAEAGPAEPGPADSKPAAKSRMMPPPGALADAAVARAQSLPAADTPQPAMAAEPANSITPAPPQPLRFEGAPSPAGSAARGADEVEIDSARGAGLGGGGGGTAGRSRRVQPAANRKMELYFLGATNDPLELSAAEAMDAPALDRRFVAIDVSAEQQDVALRFLQSQLQTAAAPTNGDATASAAVPPDRPAVSTDEAGDLGDAVDTAEAQPATTTAEQSAESLAVLVQAEPQELANLLRSLGRLTSSASSPAQVTLQSDDEANRDEVSATPTMRSAAEALDFPPKGLGGLRGAKPPMELGPEARQAVEAGKIWILLRVK